MPSNSSSEEPTLSREEQYSIGIQRVRNGASIRSVAYDLGLDRSTLGRQLQGMQSRRVTAQSRLKLSPEKEEVITGWICQEEAISRPAGFVAIRRFAAAILRQSGINTSLSRNWVKRFLQRQNARIKIKTSRNIHTARISAMTPSNIAPWFDRLNEVIR